MVRLELRKEYGVGLELRTTTRKPHKIGVLPLRDSQLSDLRAMI
jgi:hypothetical protein